MITKTLKSFSKMWFRQTEPKIHSINEMKIIYRLISFSFTSTGARAATLPVASFRVLAKAIALIAGSYSAAH
jgi:hypothetical protein